MVITSINKRCHPQQGCANGWMPAWKSFVAPENNLRHAIQQLMKAPDRESLYWSLSPKPMLRRRDVVDYANSHENIVAVVIDSLKHWDGRAQDRSSNPWQRLRCPLVTATHSE